MSNEFKTVMQSVQKRTLADYCDARRKIIESLVSQLNEGRNSAVFHLDRESDACCEFFKLNFDVGKKLLKSIAEDAENAGFSVSFHFIGGMSSWSSLFLEIDIENMSEYPARIVVSINEVEIDTSNKENQFKKNRQA